MDDNEIWIIMPLSTVGIIGLAVFVMGMGMLQAVRDWFTENLFIILIISILIAIIVAIIHWYRINLKSALCSLFSASQLIFFISYGGTNLPYGTGLKIIGSLIVFLLYIIIIVVDVCAYFFIAYSSIEECNKKDDTFSVMFNLVSGVIGWIINLIAFIILPTFFR